MSKKHGLPIGTEVFPGVVFKGAQAFYDRTLFWRLEFDVRDDANVNAIIVRGRDTTWSARSFSRDGEQYATAFGRKSPHDAVRDVLAYVSPEMAWSWE